ISVDGSRQRRAVGGPRRRRARTDAALGQASDIQGYRRMTTPADTVPKTIIKIFPETIGSFARNPADLPAPSAAPNAFTQLWKWLWLPLLVACVPAFLFGQLAAGIACLALGVILLVLALLPAKPQVEPRAELD